MAAIRKFRDKVHAVEPNSLVLISCTLPSPTTVGGLPLLPPPLDSLFLKSTRRLTVPQFFNGSKCWSFIRIRSLLNRMLVQANLHTLKHDEYEFPAAVNTENLL